MPGRIHRFAAMVLICCVVACGAPVSPESAVSSSPPPPATLAPSVTPIPSATASPSPTPTVLGAREQLELWATYYTVHPARAVDTGVPLLGLDGEPLGPLLSEDDWCGAALEGTVSVERDGTQTVYNYGDSEGPDQVDCTEFYPGLTDEILEAMGRTRFIVSEAPYGYGVMLLLLYLVPYKTIAVDPEFIPYGTILYIPEAKGVEVELPSGETVAHDGFFFTADTGGAIEGNHIDVFAGMYQGNPFPSFVHSDPSRTFAAYVVENAEILTEMKRLHDWD